MLKFRAPEALETLVVPGPEEAGWWTQHVKKARNKNATSNLDKLFAGMPEALRFGKAGERWPDGIHAPETEEFWRAMQPFRGPHMPDNLSRTCFTTEAAENWLLENRICCYAIAYEHILLPVAAEGQPVATALESTDEKDRKRVHKMFRSWCRNLAKRWRGEHQ